MNCDFCGAATPPGAPYCNFCGRPMALNAAGQERPPGAGNFPGPVPQTPPSQYTTAYPFSSAPATGSHQPVAVPHQGPYNAPQYPSQVPIDQITTLPQPTPQGGQPSQQFKLFQFPAPPSGRTLIKPPFATDELPPIDAGQTELYSGSSSQSFQHYRSPGTQDLPPVSPDQPAEGYFPSTQFSPSQNVFMAPQGSPDTGSLQMGFDNNPFAPPDLAGTYTPVDLAIGDEDSSDNRYKAWLQPRGRKKTLIIGAGALLAVILIGIFVTIMLLPLANPSKPGSTNIGGSSAIPTTTGQGSNPNATPGQKGTATNSKGIPSSSAINKDAAAIISEVKTANKVDEKTLQPTKTTDKFKPKEVVYITFKLDSKDKDGYILAQWFGNGHEVGSKIHKHKSDSDRGLFGLDYHDPATGAVALYWCNKEKCEDKKLAAVATFTVVADKPANGTPTTSAQSSLMAFSRRVR